MKTLIHHGGSLGDTLLSLTSIAAIRKNSSSIHFIGRKDVAECLSEAGCVEAFSSAGSAVHAPLYSKIGTRERQFLAAFDRAFVFTIQRTSPLAENISSVVPRTRIIATIPSDGAEIHAAQYRLAQCSSDAPSLLPPRLAIPQSYLDGAKALLKDAGFVEERRLIAVHPGSGGLIKCWPIDRYFDLADGLAKIFNAFFLFFSGPDEEQELKRRIDRFSLGREDVLHVSGRKLAAAAALLSRCSLYFGNDSGFSHLAAAVNCRVIALFGPTNPLIWRPLGRSVEIVSAGFPSAMDQITVDTLVRKAAELLWIPLRHELDAPHNNAPSSKCEVALRYTDVSRASSG